MRSASAAEKASFRPCLRCRPELAPGHAPMDQAHRLADLIVQRMDEGLADEGAGLEEIAAQFGLSSRQLRRIVQQELGVSPIELIQTRRLLLAKQLLTDTRLPVIEIAFASGFSSQPSQVMSRSSKMKSRKIISRNIPPKAAMAGWAPVTSAS